MVATRKRLAPVAKQTAKTQEDRQDALQPSGNLRHRKAKENKRINAQQPIPRKTRKQARPKLQRRVTLDEIIPQATRETIDETGGKKKASVESRSSTSRQHINTTSTSERLKNAPATSDQGGNVISDVQDNAESSFRSKGPSEPAGLDNGGGAVDQDGFEISDDEESSLDENMIEEDLLDVEDEPTSKTPQLPVYLSFDVLHLIISSSQDQQSLHTWQLVNYDAYLLATPLLYSRGATLSTARGYESFLCGSRPHRRRSDGPACDRVTRKADLLALVPAIKVTGVISVHGQGLWTFITTPVECFKSLRKLWIVHDQANLSRMSDKRFAPIRTWFEKFELLEVHLGCPGSITAEDEPSKNSLALALALIALQCCLSHSTRPPAIFRHYEGHFTKIDYLSSNDTLEIVLSDSLDSDYLVQRFISLYLQLLTCYVPPQTVRIYGVGSPPPRDQLGDAWELVACNNRPRPPPGLLSAYITGSEAECQKVVGQYLTSLLQIYEVPTKLEFKLHSELTPFFE